MADTELLIPLAEIAGVLVGFGALIAVRSAGASGALEVGYTRGMVSFGLLTIVAALAPVTMGRFDLTEHQVWALSSVVVLVGTALTFAAFVRTPEFRANWAADIEATRTRSRPLWFVVAENATSALGMLVWVLSPIVILLGVAPDLEAGLYYLVVVLILLCAAMLLLGLVFAPRLPERA